MAHNQSRDYTENVIEAYYTRILADGTRSEKHFVKNLRWLCDYSYHIKKIYLTVHGDNTVSLVAHATQDRIFTAKIDSYEVAMDFMKRRRAWHKLPVFITIESSLERTVA